MRSAWTALSAALLALCAPPSDAFVEIELLRPLPGARFATNNPELVVKGVVRSSGGAIRIAVEAPGGFSRLDGSETPVSEMILDAGAEAEPLGILFQPVMEETPAGWRSYGPRELDIWADGGEPRRYRCASGVGDPSGEARVLFDPPLRGRRFALRWTSGWQRAADGSPDVRLTAVSLIGASARAAQVSARIPQPRPEEPFLRTARLLPGPNRIRVFAAHLETGETAAAEIEAELTDPFAGGAADETVTLSDGSGLTLAMPPGSVDETMRGIRLIRIDPSEIPLRSYRNHRMIDSEAPPLAAYRFEGLFQTAFYAEATAALPGQPASLAADGRASYPSTWIAARAPFPIVWRVDLGRVESVGRITVRARQDGGVSYGPGKASVLLSLDGENFQTAAESVSFADWGGSVALPPGSLARWAALSIEEGKAAHNIVQINEVELYDDSGGRIAAQESQSAVQFLSPALVELRFPTGGADAGLFMLDPQTNRWDWTGASGADGVFAFETNALAPLALFRLRGAASPLDGFSARWTVNPFSPNGDGSADRSRLLLSAPMNAPGGLHPNPIWYTVKIYDLRGKLIRTLADRAQAAAGAMAVEWDGSDRAGQPAPIGAYLYVAEARGEDGQTAVYRGLIAIVR